MSQRCVVLLGLMGAGKTSVGEALADTIGYEFIDTDALVEERAGMPISEIFAADGEDGFRRLEHKVIDGLRGSEAKVIATGGGAVLDPANREVLAGLGLTVYLKASPRELYQRIKNDTGRPLITGAADPLAEMKHLLSAREQYYLKADVIIDTEDLAIEEVADKLIDELARRTQGDG